MSASTDGRPGPVIALVYPDLLGTYGDSGNATILAQRLRWRGFAAEVITVLAGDAVPDSCDIYVVGGGEDLPQCLAARELGGPRPLHRAVAAGAAVFAVCAGLQIVGTSFVGPDGVETGRPRSARLPHDPRSGTAGGGGAGRRPRPGGRPAGADRLRKPRRRHHSRGRAADRPGVSASASATATGPTAPSPGTCTAPTCTARSWPATRPSPTCC